MTTSSVDLAVIGAGPGGYVAAIRAAQLGLSVTIVEREHMGGICLNWGCIPTKALLRSAEIYSAMKQAKEYGLSVGSVGFELNDIVDRSRAVAKRLNGGVGYLMKKNGIEVHMGEAKLLEPTRITVSSEKGDAEIQCKNTIIATGARARELPGLEADGVLVWNYKHALKPNVMPKKLLVIGSGAIGIEFASFYNTLGAKTTVVEVMDRILPVEDAEISGIAKTVFEKQGMTIMEGSSVTRLDRQKNSVKAFIRTSEQEVAEEFDRVISATGILGNIENLGLEELGVETEKSHIVVDEFCRTNVKNLYAIGDVAGAPWLAHKASHEGVAVAELIAGEKPHPVHPESIAGCTYCLPQIASVGLTEQQANESGRKVRVGRFPWSANGKAIALGETEGLVKTVFDADSGELLGAHMIGAEVTELIQGFVIGRQLETTEEDLMGAVFPHPTLSEGMHESVLAAFDRVVHI